MNDKTSVFDYLHEWDLLTDNQIRKLISADTLNMMQEIVEMLDDECTLPISDQNFVYLVRIMRELYREGSQKLGHSIIVGSDLRDEGNYKEAKLVYERFILNCPSKFYRDIANHQLKEIEDLIQSKK